MEDLNRTRPQDRPTLVDLGILIAGFAVGLPRMGFGSGSVPRLVEIGVVLRILVGATPFAASAVIIVRRFRFGGFPRAIEWSVLVLAMIQIAAQFPPAGFIRNYVPGQRPGVFQYSQAPGWVCWTELGLSGASSLSCVVILRIARGHLAEWIRTILILLAISSFCWGPASLFADALQMRQHWSRSWIDDFGLETVAQLPRNLLWGIPAASALVDSFWRGRRSSGLERLAYLTLFVSLFFVGILDLLVRSSTSGLRTLGDSLWSERYLLSCVMSLLLAVPLALWLGPIWRRWLGRGYDGTPTS